MRDWMLYARDVEANAMEHFRWGEPVSVTRTTSDHPSELAQCTATSGENATNQNKLKMKEKIHLLFFFRPNRSFFYIWLASEAMRARMVWEMCERDEVSDKHNKWTFRKLFCQNIQFSIQLQQSYCVHMY